MKKTRVINVRGRKRQELEADPNFVYVGRAIPRLGWKGSPFANPFREGAQPIAALQVFAKLKTLPAIRISFDGPLSREQAVEFYEYWLKSQPELMARIPELRGRTLGCWCVPQACHASVLARLADAAAEPR